MTLRGVEPETVRDAIERADPLPGTRGFAGRLPDGRLVRDVLGRQPLFAERDADDPTADGAWAFDRRELDDPVPVPAGHVRTADGDRSVWSLPEPEPTADRERAVADVREAIDGALAELGDPPVAFSGGVDSALVADASDGPLSVVGFPGSHDLAAARDTADRMDRELHVVELTHDDLTSAVPSVVDAIGRTNAMDVTIALSLFLVARRVATDGYDRLAVGQGADELFGGYAKVARAPDDPRTDADTVRGAAHELIRTLPDQLERDVCTLRAAGVEPVAPLLDDRVVDAALRLPADLLSTGDDERKLALRKVARNRLPDAVADRDKKAVQYGSYVSRELDRLARQAGFKRRMDDHVTKYVESLVET